MASPSTGILSRLRRAALSAISPSTHGPCWRSGSCRCACLPSAASTQSMPAIRPIRSFIIGGFYKLFGKKFLFDHHDINPELYEAKFERRDVFYRLMLALERMTFKTADVCVATNESYRRIAIERGERRPEKVFVVRSGPDLRRLKILPPDPALEASDDAISWAMLA